MIPIPEEHTMVNPKPSNDEFYARALASLNQQMALASTAAAVEIESYAKSLVEDDHPKIDSAVKSYLSLVAARSAVASDVDVISDVTPISSVQCTFATWAKSPRDANRCALMCARTLLSTINSTSIPPPESTAEGPSTTSAKDTNNDETTSSADDEEKLKMELLQKNATQILWNRLVHSISSSNGDKTKQTKPSKVLGRDSLQVAYPYIQERLRRGILLNDNGGAVSATVSQNNNPLQSLSNELLPPVTPPKGIDIDQWEAFHTEFGFLLDRACGSSNNEKEPSAQSAASKVEQHDDSALLWSGDKGSAELRQRRETRAQRAAEALGSVESVKAVLTDAVLGSVAGDDGDNSSS